MKALRAGSRKIVEMLDHRSVDVCCEPENRFRGAWVTLTSGKEAEHKLRGSRNFLGKEMVM